MDKDSVEIFIDKVQSAMQRNLTIIQQLQKSNIQLQKIIDDAKSMFVM